MHISGDAQDAALDHQLPNTHTHARARMCAHATYRHVRLRPRSPDYALGAHVAALGLIFSDQSALNKHFGPGTLISEHGSWNRKPRSGYKVVFVSFKNNLPDGMPIDIVTDFVVNDEAHGRPVGLAIDQDGNLLIADDVGNRVWRVRPKPTNAIATKRGL